MAVIMRDAIKPNLLQTLENTPVIVHAGPFGNIAHGNSSIVGDLIGIHGGDYLITEAGFGADMGAERFFNIKCRASGLVPDAAVLVATVRALKAHSGKYKIVAGKPLPPDLLRREPRRRARRRRQPAQADRERQGPRRVARRRDQRLPDRPRIRARRRSASRRGDGRARRGVHALRRRWRGRHRPRPGRRRGVRRAERVPLPVPRRRDRSRRRSSRSPPTIYGAERVEYTPAANTPARQLRDNGFGHLPVCIAKTHLSISGDASLKGAPTGHTLNVREVRASVGAGFVYPICGDMRTMPGLGGHPAASIIDFDENGEIVGLTHDRRRRGDRHRVRAHAGRRGADGRQPAARRDRGPAPRARSRRPGHRRCAWPPCWSATTSRARSTCASKHKKAEEAGMQSQGIELPETASQAEVEDAVDALAADPSVHGILCQLPLPAGLDPEPVLAAGADREGCRRADRELDGPPRARPARARRLHAARRDAPARALRRRDRRQAGRRRRALDAGRPADGAAARPQGRRRHRHAGPFAHGRPGRRVPRGRHHRRRRRLRPG